MSVHWLMAAGYLILFMTGSFMARLPREFFIRSPLYDFHKSIGALVMAILTWRIIVLLQVWWKKYTKRLPKLSRKWWQKASLHALLYVFMWAVPVSGFFFSNSFKSNNVKLFGIVLPDLFPQNEALVDLGRNLHFWLAYTFLVFIILHTLDQRKVLRANWKRFLGFVKAKFAAS
ncbi:cytochrome b [[Limnothrix rosea] IAM M-220]|uniref:cytochrome b n=1 Tax=[Limnothrix rosea] IAM M-220 TaxID=454133 RepID=UPI001F36A3AE|nr:cytochrome b [[Limnothrix rosea] IAM M-220]